MRKQNSAIFTVLFFHAKGLGKPIQHFIQYMLDEILDKMLEECRMKVYVVCTCHPTCFIQYASLFSLLFDVILKMATDMFLPMILSGLVDSDGEKPP